MCACVRLLASVAPPVLPQVRGGREALVALRALVRPFARVGAAVFGQRRLLREAPAALGARKGPLARVYADVLGQCGAACKGAAAVPARVWARRVRRRRWCLARDLRGEGNRSALMERPRSRRPGAPPAAASPSPVFTVVKSQGVHLSGRLCNHGSPTLPVIGGDPSQTTQTLTVSLSSGTLSAVTGTQAMVLESFTDL